MLLIIPSLNSRTAIVQVSSYLELLRRKSKLTKIFLLEITEAINIDKKSYHYQFTAMFFFAIIVYILLLKCIKDNFVSCENNKCRWVFRFTLYKRWDLFKLKLKILFLSNHIVISIKMKMWRKVLVLKFKFTLDNAEWN